MKKIGLFQLLIYLPANVRDRILSIVKEYPEQISKIEDRIDRKREAIHSGDQAAINSIIIEEKKEIHSLIDSAKIAHVQTKIK